MNEFSMFELLNEFHAFSRKDLKNRMKESNINISDSSLTRLLNKMTLSGFIKKNDHEYHVISDQMKVNYRYTPSDKLSEIKALIKEAFPYIEFEVWEYIQLNDFINHLIGKNTYFIETEKDYELAIFALLNEHYPRVLLDPSFDTFSLYSMDEPIVVKRLISRTPKNEITPFQPTIEKLLIDLMQDAFTSKLINNHELKRIYQECEKTYYLNHKAMQSYAKRRNAQKKLEDLQQAVKGKD